MELHPCSLSELSSAQVSFAACSLPSTPFAKALVVTFSGKADNSRAFSGTFKFMNAMIAAGVAAWEPFGVVLDLRELSYEWGDEMERVLDAARNPRRTLPTTAVVSDLNREGLTSLVAQEMFADPADWLFETVDDAIAAVDGKVIVQRQAGGLDNLIW